MDMFGNCESKLNTHLIHSGIGEENGRIVVRNDRGRVHVLMLVFGLEKADELIADLLGGQCSRHLVAMIV